MELKKSNTHKANRPAMLLTNIKGVDKMAGQEVDSLCAPADFEEYHGTPINTADTAIDS